MASENRVVRVSAGAAEYVTGKVTERSGEDITAATFEIGLGGFESPPATWAVPSVVEFEGTSIARVSMLVNASTPLAARAHLWVRMTDAPEVLPRRCDGGTITVE